MDASYATIALKLAIGIIGLIIQINILGKGNLAPISAMDQVQNYVLGGIIGGVIYNSDITALQFVLVLIVWTFLVLLLKFLKEHNYWVKRVIDGAPVTVIKNGGVDVATTMRVGLSASELMFKLRAAGVDEVQIVRRAVLEQNGQLTIIKYGEEAIKYPLIQDGQANYDLLDVLDKDIDWLRAEVAKQKMGGVEDIYLGEFIHGKVILHPFAK